MSPGNRRRVRNEIHEDAKLEFMIVCEIVRTGFNVYMIVFPRKKEVKFRMNPVK